jgi:hypothetical protein
VSSNACCFCRRLAKAEEIEARLWICPRCAGRSRALFSSGYSGGSAGGWGRLYLIRDDGKTVDLGHYFDWSADPKTVLRDHADKLNRSLDKLAAGL